MKKRLEADLISIAHRILQLKNKSDINLLYLETQKLYEKLAVLRFVDEHFGDAKPTISHADIQKQIEAAFESNAVVPRLTEIKEETIETPLESVSKPVSALEIETHVITEESLAEQSPLEDVVVDGEIFSEEKQIPAFKPTFELAQEEEEDPETEAPKKQEAIQISFEDLLGGNFDEAQFVKVNPLENIPTAIALDFEKKELIAAPKAIDEEPTEPKAVSLNEKLAKGIHIDLNDRIAFVKNLFGNSNEDYNRVLNQLITFDSFQETQDFIEDMVKPDYNNWEGKEDYSERFMEIIEKKFS